MIPYKDFLKVLTLAFRKQTVIYRHGVNLHSFDKESCLIEKLCLDFDREVSFMVTLGLYSQERYNEFKVRHIFFQLKSHLSL